MYRNTETKYATGRINRLTVIPREREIRSGIRNDREGFRVASSRFSPPCSDSDGASMSTVKVFVSVLVSNFPKSEGGDDDSGVGPISEYDSSDGERRLPT